MHINNSTRNSIIKKKRFRPIGSTPNGSIGEFKNDSENYDRVVKSKTTSDKT